MNKYDINGQNKQKAKATYFKPVLSNSRFWQLLMLMIILIISALAYADKTSTKVPQITVYKSPTCGCCTKWIKHLEKNGFRVESINSKKMQELKRTIGVNPKYQSCHTGLIDGYYIEGHVPAKDIKRLLKEKPHAIGLSVPGMPMGSPGMEGPRKDPYSVLLIKKDKTTEVYSKN